MSCRWSASLAFLLVGLAGGVDLSAGPERGIPTLSEEEAWTLVLLPDPQTYQRFERNQGIFDLMTAWVAEQIEPLHIELVLCTGDLVQYNSMIDPDGRRSNQTSRQQWEAVSRGFARLDGKVPYIAAAGNHDYGYRNISTRMTHYDEYFPVERNHLNQRLLRRAELNAEGRPTLENAVYEMKTPTGDRFLILSLEFAPRDSTLAWAAEILADPGYAAHRAIVLTHSYLNHQGRHIVEEDYPITDGNYGRAIWEKLVQPSRNVEMVFSGHIGAPDDFEAHVGYRVDLNAGGRHVHQIVFNAQAMGGGWAGNGGDGWLRLFEFQPDGRTVRVRTYSPFFALSPSTRHLAWSTEPFNEFTFQLDPRS